MLLLCPNHNAHYSLFPPRPPARRFPFSFLRPLLQCVPAADVRLLYGTEGDWEDAYSKLLLLYTLGASSKADTLWVADPADVLSFLSGILSLVGRHPCLAFVDMPSVRQHAIQLTSLYDAALTVLEKTALAGPVIDAVEELLLATAVRLAILLTTTLCCLGYAHHSLIQYILCSLEGRLSLRLWLLM